MNKKDIEALNEAYDQMQPENNKSGPNAESPIDIEHRAIGAGGGNFRALVYYPQGKPRAQMEQYLSALYNELPEEFERDPKRTPGAGHIPFHREERDFRIDVNDGQQLSADIYEVDFDITFTNDRRG